jgi:hypothetical protein
MPPPSPDLQFVAILSTDERSGQHRSGIADSAVALDPSACDFASISSGRILRAYLESLLI